MKLTECFEKKPALLMEGALGERLKREYHLAFDAHVDMAGLVYEKDGRNALNALWSGYADIAAAHRLPFLATTPTRRTNRERIARSRFDARIIRDNVAFLREVQGHQRAQMYVGGLLGCHGDAYTGVGALSFEESREFHAWETALFAETGVDFLYAALMPSFEEAAGMAAAAGSTELPYFISFTIQKNGCLVDGTRLADAIDAIDALPVRRPLCYMTNCVHPTIVYEALSQPFNRTASVRSRFLGIQANTSALSYVDLDGSNELKTSEPVELAEAMERLRTLCPIKIFGGCCGTDNRHMEEIAKRISKVSTEI